MHSSSSGSGWLLCSQPIYGSSEPNQPSITNMPAQASWMRPRIEALNLFKLTFRPSLARHKRECNHEFRMGLLQHVGLIPDPINGNLLRYKERPVATPTRIQSGSAWMTNEFIPRTGLSTVDTLCMTITVPVSSCIWSTHQSSSSTLKSVAWCHTI